MPPMNNIKHLFLDMCCTVCESLNYTVVQKFNLKYAISFNLCFLLYQLTINLFTIIKQKVTIFDNDTQYSYNMVVISI